MRAIETTQFHDADKYSSYLSTPAGRLRLELAWENLRRLLPADAARRRVLDVGGGAGAISLRLAKMKFQVVLLDSAEEMLGIAKKEAEASGIATRISFRHADAAKLQELFEPASFDLVLCHNLLEYVADPATLAAMIAHVLRKDAVVSFVTRNRAGEVLKAAIKSDDWALAKENLTAETVLDSLYGKPVRVFEPKDIMEVLARSGLEQIALYGLRVFSDHRNPKDLADEAAYQQVLQLELLLGARPEFASIARYTQVIARRATGSQEKRG